MKRFIGKDIHFLPPANSCKCKMCYIAVLEEVFVCYGCGGEI